MSRREEQLARLAKLKQEQDMVDKNNVALEQGGLNVVYVDVNDINPNSYNPNRQTDKDFELLRSSIRADGFTQPVIVIRHNNEIVDGEHRWRAAIAEGYAKVPVVYVDMTPEQQRISTLRHNRARGSEDMNLAAELLRDLEARGASDFAQTELLISSAEMDFMLQDVKPPEILEAPEVIEAKAANPDDRSAIADATRVAEKRIEAEKAAEDRLRLAKDLDIFRVDLSFVTEEWWIVKPSVGMAPGAGLLKLCEWKLAQLGETEEVPA